MDPLRTVKESMVLTASKLIPEYAQLPVEPAFWALISGLTDLALKDPCSRAVELLEIGEAMAWTSLEARGLPPHENPFTPILDQLEQQNGSH